MISIDVFMSFREDLRNGMTLEKALLKYGLSLREVFQYCHRRNLESKYCFIYIHQGGFNIMRWQGSERVYYARCRELDDAVRLRDRLMECNWDKSQVPRIMEELGL